MKRANLRGENSIPSADEGACHNCTHLEEEPLNDEYSEYFCSLDGSEMAFIYEYGCTAFKRIRRKERNNMEEKRRQVPSWRKGQKYPCDCGKKIGVNANNEYYCKDCDIKWNFFVKR